MVAIVLLLLGFAGTPVMAEYEPSEEDAACFMCHDDATLTSETGPKKSLHVDPSQFGRSVHAEVGCVSCHQDLDPEDLPHDAPLEPVDCSGCHDGRAAMTATVSTASCHQPTRPPGPISATSPASAVPATARTPRWWDAITSTSTM
jgi:hypothetical protein